MASAKEATSMSPSPDAEVDVESGATPDSQPSVETECRQTASTSSQDEKYQELHDQFIRLQADFQNYRKRMETEKDALLKYGSERTMTSLLSVLDNLNRGTASLSESSDPKLLYQSFRLVYNQLMEGLGNLGLSKMDVVGQPFDPNFHEAVQHVPSSDYPENVIVNELQPGFMLYDRVLRPALVAVSNGAVEVASHAQQSDDENPFKGQ